MHSTLHCFYITENFHAECGKRKTRFDRFLMFENCEIFQEMSDGLENYARTKRRIFPNFKLNRGPAQCLFRAKFFFFFCCCCCVLPFIASSVSIGFVQFNCTVSRFILMGKMRIKPLKRKKEQARERKKLRRVIFENACEFSLTAFGPMCFSLFVVRFFFCFACFRLLLLLLFFFHLLLKL